MKGENVMSNPKYHHLIPQTYMKAWCYSNQSVYISYIENLSESETKNIENLGGVQNYHTLKAGMQGLQKSDTDKIFEVTKDYNIKYDGKVITDTLELNNIYGLFDDWEVSYLNGNPASKKKLKHAIDTATIKEIETLWSKVYENGWNELYKKINSQILGSHKRKVQEFDKEYLMEFSVALNWRSFNSNDIFSDAYENMAHPLKSILIPPKERIFPFLETAYDEIYHCILLKKYREFLNEKGMIYENALIYIKYMSFHFYVADGNTTFITSDNPSFSFKRDEDDLKAAMLPISPKILMIIGRNSTKETNYYISRVSDEVVKKYNKIILEHARKYIIIDDPNINHF